MTRGERSFLRFQMKWNSTREGRVQDVSPPRKGQTFMVNRLVVDVVIKLVQPDDRKER